MKSTDQLSLIISFAGISSIALGLMIAIIGTAKYNLISWLPITAGIAAILAAVALYLSGEDTA